MTVQQLLKDIEDEGMSRCWAKTEAGREHPKESLGWGTTLRSWAVPCICTARESYTSFKVCQEPAVVPAVMRLPHSS